MIENDFLRAAVAEFRGIGCQGGTCYPPRNRWGATGGRGGSFPKGFPSQLAAKTKPGSRKAKTWGALEKKGKAAEKRYNRATAKPEADARKRRGAAAARELIKSNLKAGRPISSKGRAAAIARSIASKRSGD